MFRALSTMIVIFGLMILGYFLFAAPPKPVTPLPNVAISLIDVMGDGNNIRAGQVTTRCLSQKTDGISDQFEMLVRKIVGSPGNTHYFHGVYITLTPGGRRPMFQVRYPDPKYCDAFISSFESCYAEATKGGMPEQIMGPASECVQVAAKGLNVTEDWAGLIEQYSKRR